ncbi:MAG: cobalamin B12-binding domain-containing protein [Planctomycetota bacterium]
MILSARRAYAAGAVERQLELQPEAASKYGDAGAQDLRGDTEIRLRYLAEALGVERVGLFLDHVSWLKVAQTARGLPLEYLDGSLLCLAEELEASLPKGATTMSVEYLQTARKHLADAPTTLPSLLEGEGEHIDLARQYLLAVLETRSDDALALVNEAFDKGMSAADIHQHLIQPAQLEIGRMWQMGEIHVAEEHYASRVAERVVAALHEKAPRAESHAGRIICATASGELHDLGIRVVAQHLEWAGWQTILLGASMPVHDLLLALGDFEADVIAISASSALHVSAVAGLLDVVRNQSIRPDLPVLVGGAPFTVVPDLWQVLGADACAGSARQAVEAAAKFVG